MLADAKNAELYSEWVAQIDAEDVRDAFHFIVGLAAASTEYTCHPQFKGEVRDVRFITGDEQTFAFIPNKSWLLFYIRLPAVRSQKYKFKDLQAAFDSALENNTGEWTVRLRSIADVQRLWRFLALT